MNRTSSPVADNHRCEPMDSFLQSEGADEPALAF